jgi:hypothetical protein
VRRRLIIGSGRPSGRAGALAVLRQVAQLLVCPERPRTAGRGVGFAASDVEALSEGSGALATVDPMDASSAVAVPATSFVNASVSVGVCSLSVARSVGGSSGFVVFGAGGVSTDRSDVAAARETSPSTDSSVNVVSVVAFSSTIAVATPAAGTGVRSMRNSQSRT